MAEDVEESACEELTNNAKLVIKKLARDINYLANRNGFWESTNDGEKIALMHSELSEALEALRHGNPKDEHCPEFGNAEIELADCIIRILDYTYQKNMDIAGAIIAKMKYNESRPYKHGKNF